MTEKMVQNGFSKLVLKAAKMYHSQAVADHVTKTLCISVFVISQL